MRRKRTFPQMVKLIPAGEAGQFYIEHVTVTKKDSERTGFGGGMSYVPPGRYCMLKQNSGINPSWDKVWMSDTSMERQTNYEAYHHAHGHVLVGGLGIGMVAVALCRKKEVKTVTVLEIEPEVIRLVEPHIRHHKLRVILADVNQPPLRRRHFDTVYLDIWRDICSDNWKTMKPLLAQYRKFRVQGGIVMAWLKDWCQREHNNPNGWY